MTPEQFDRLEKALERIAKASERKTAEWAFVALAWLLFAHYFGWIKL